MKKLVIAVVVLALLGFGWWESSKPPLDSGTTDNQGMTALPAVSTRDGLTVIGDTAFARRYGAADATAEEDLQAVAGVLDAAVLLVKDIDRFPLPDNAAFTTFLQGGNPHRVAWILPGHPAVSGAGELLDRWGTPLFFHRESSRRTGLRSAGPDREMWTEDDVVWPEDDD